MDELRRKIQSAIARMTMEEIRALWIPTEFSVDTPRNPKAYRSEKDHLVAWMYSAVMRMSYSQLLGLRIPAHMMR